MKHYTLPEHRTFCIESGINVKSEWMEVGKLGWLPEGIYHAPDQSFNPEYKEWRKEWDKKYRSIPENKARKKEYKNRPHSIPGYRAEKKEYDKKYRSIPENKARKKEYDKRRWRNKK